MAPPLVQRVCVCVCVMTELPGSASNVSVLEEASTWVRLSAAAPAPRRDAALPITHWTVKYQLADDVHTGGQHAARHSASRLFTDGEIDLSVKAPVD